MTVKTEVILKNAYFFPEKLNTTGTVNPEKKHRGIYSTAVFKTQLAISGEFLKPNFNSIDIKDEDILWKKTRIILQTSNLKGINNEVGILLNNKTIPFIPKFENSTQNQKLHKLETEAISNLEFDSKNKLAFNIKIDVNGSESIQFIPIGKETKNEYKIELD